MGAWQPTSWNISNRLLFVSSIPSLLIVAILVTYHLISHFQAEDRHVRIFGEAIAANSGVVSELGIISGDTETLEQLAHSIISQTGVVGVAFFDDAKNLLLQEHTLEHLSLDDSAIELKDGVSGYHSRYLRYFVAAVVPSVIDVSDFDGISGSADDSNLSVQPAPAGWIVIFVDESDIAAHRREHARDAILIGAFGLLLAFVISMRVAGSIVNPLQAVTRAVGRIAEGNLKSRVQATGGGELGKLQDGINQMAELMDGHSESLKSEVAEATLQLQQTLSELEDRNTELEKASELAEAASAAKDKFVARMSHELRTPITSISGFLELMRATPLSEQQSEFVEIATQASNTLLGTINDILHVAEFEQSGIELEAHEFELESALDNMMSMHAWSAFDKGVELVINIDRDVPGIINADEIRLIQICNNLVANSVKFTDQGQVVVSVSATEGEENTRLLTFAVRDSGIGIEQEHLSRIFEPFYQGDTSIRRRYGGTGLGLLIAKTMVETMGGELGITSEPGKGSEVTFTIPARGSSSPEQDELLNPDSSILIFDTNLWSQRSMRNRSLKITHNVFVCDSLNKLPAVLRVNKEPPDCMIVSLSAAESGVEDVVRYLKSISAYYRGKVLLVLSTLKLDTVDAAVEEFGFESLQLISKPVRNEKLFAALQRETAEEGELQPEQTRVEQQRGLPVWDGADVLLAEDNAHNRKLIEMLLSGRGLKVKSVPDGEQALTALMDGNFELALLDLHMPNMDGIEVARRYGNEKDSDACAVVLLTADPVAMSPDDLRRSGIAEVLHKPLEQEKLWQLLQRRLPGARTRSAEEEPEGMLNIDAGVLTIEIESLVTGMERCLHGDKYEQLLDYTHQLKGLTGLTRKNGLFDICNRFEQAVAAEDKALQLIVFGELTRAVRVSQAAND